MNERTNEDLIQNIQSYGFIASKLNNEILIGNSYTRTKLDVNIIHDINAYHNTDQGDTMMDIVFTTLGLSRGQFTMDKIEVYPKGKTRTIVELFKVEPIYHG